MQHIDHIKIAKDVKGYNLFDKVKDRCSIVIDGGVARSTIYKALSQGPVTDTLEKILEAGAAVVAEHEAKIEQLTAVATDDISFGSLGSAGGA